MVINTLYIFVEGNDDELFFRRALIPLFERMYDKVNIFQYSQKKREKVENFLASIRFLDYDYVFVADRDERYSLNEKRHLLLHKYSNIEKERLAIVINEIESWFLAGIPSEFARVYRLPVIENTDETTKEDFNQYYRGRFHSRIDFMQEILKYWQLEVARHKNHSFDFFVNNYLKPCFEPVATDLADAMS